MGVPFVHLVQYDVTVAGQTLAHCQLGEEDPGRHVHYTGSRPWIYPGS